MSKPSTTLRDRGYNSFAIGEFFWRLRMVQARIDKYDKLCDREVETLELAAQGLSNRQIAVRMQIAARTVEGNLYNIYSKLGASNRVDAVLIGIRCGLIVVDGIVAAQSS